MDLMSMKSLSLCEKLLANFVGCKWVSLFHLNGDRGKRNGKFHNGIQVLPFCLYEKSFSSPYKCYSVNYDVTFLQKTNFALPLHH